jgi:hypothetical protein
MLLRHTADVRRSLIWQWGISAWNTEVQPFRNILKLQRAGRVVRLTAVVP